MASQGPELQLLLIVHSERDVHRLGLVTLCESYGDDERLPLGKFQGDVGLSVVTGGDAVVGVALVRDAHTLAPSGGAAMPSNPSL